MTVGIAGKRLLSIIGKGDGKMSEKELKELKERIHDEYARCMNAITGIDKEMCRLQGRREELEDRQQMLWELINK